MNNNKLMMYLQLAFIDYNDYASHHDMFEFFTREVNGEIELYSVPEYNEIKIPLELPKLLRYINRTKDDNMFSLDVIFDLSVLLKRIRKEGLIDYPDRYADQPIIRSGTILCDAVILDEETKYYRVVNSTRNMVKLVQIENHHGRPILSQIRSKILEVKVEHNAIFVDG